MERWKQELYHHGIKGQRWGVRRFQNRDGSLTSNGRVRYNIDNYVSEKKTKKQSKKASIARGRSIQMDYYDNAFGKYKNSSYEEHVRSLDSSQRQDLKNYNKHITKKSVAIGAAVVGGTVLAAYGATKYKKLVNTRTVADAASAYSKVASGVSKAAISRATATKASTAASTVAKTVSTVTSTAKKAASTAKSASKPILTLSGNDAGFSQADMDRMLNNLGKMSDLARSGQDIVRNL